MAISLGEILSLVGKLDDTPGDDNARERFRNYLKVKVNEVGQIRDYVDEAIRINDSQHNRALQDLINYIGYFMGFDVIFGRYSGVSGQIGFDGIWTSPTGLNVVVEVKTSETYPIKTATLISYIDTLISEKKIQNWNHALGIYVVGRFDPEVKQLENSILAENNTHRLRVISAENLLSLAELMNEYDVNHEDIISIFRPSGPKIDPIVDLMSRLIAHSPPPEPPVVEVACEEEKSRELDVSKELDVIYWLTPVKADEKASAEAIIQELIDIEGIYAFGERTPGRKRLKPGDMICFYAAGNGVVAHAEVASYPEKISHPKIHDSDKYPWVFQVKNSKPYLDDPIIIDSSCRSRLDAFKDRDPNKPWGWFVVATNKLSRHDFDILTSYNRH